MNQAVRVMLDRYACRSAADFEHALREIFQELALLGLWRGRFFERAAFYGGTALRILHGVERFSEDMDFSLLAPDDTFDFAPYCGFVEKELTAWGFPVSVEVKRKSTRTAIESAFLKANTLSQLMVIETPSRVLGGIHGDRKLTIKMEVDTDPPADFLTETRFLLQPIPFSVRVFNLPCLFAGKMHALLFRKWARRVKGRDWFDWVWYVAKGVPLDLQHLSARMGQTGDWRETAPLPEERLRDMLRAAIDALDVESARKDVLPFVKDSTSVALWSRAFFLHVAERMAVRERSLDG